jgi:hypothetical protein
MTENVIPLRPSDATPPAPKEPHEGLVRMLERLLQEARTGELVGLACAYNSGDWRAGYAVVGYVGGFSMQGALHCAMNDISDINRADLDGDDED